MKRNGKRRSGTPSLCLLSVEVGFIHTPQIHNTTHKHNITQHNITQHNTNITYNTQHNTQHNTTRHNTTQHNTTQHTTHNTTHTRLVAGLDDPIPERFLRLDPASLRKAHFVAPLATTTGGDQGFELPVPPPAPSVPDQSARGKTGPASSVGP